MKRLLFAHLFFACTAFAQRVPWTVETTPISSTQAGDPTFFPGPQLVVGTDRAALGVYFWTPGQFPAVVPDGLVNAADARGDLLVVSSPGTSALFVYQSTDAGLVRLSTGAFNPVSPGEVALARRTDGGLEVFTDNSALTIARYRMAVNSGNAMFTALPSVTVAEQPSGLAFDERTSRLYVAQPNRGVVVVEPNQTQRLAISTDAGTLGAIVGGVDVLPIADGGLLIVTAAPNEGEIRLHSEDGALVAALVIGEPDGGAVTAAIPRRLDVFAQPAGPSFPQGMLIVEDDSSGTYKLVSLADVTAALGLPPLVDGGQPDAGSTDAGPTDAGTSDAGTSDAGVMDGGVLTDGGVDAGRPGGFGGGTGGSGGGPPKNADPVPPQGCSCSGSPFALLFALLSLWFVRRRRTAP